MVVALALGEPMGIANRVSNRHNNVMQSIERLAMRGVIGFSPMGEKPYTQGTDQQSGGVR